MQASAKLDGVSALHFGKVVEYLVGIFGSRIRAISSADAEVVETHGLNALIGCQGHNAGRTGAHLKTLRTQRRPESTHRRCDHNEVPQILKPELVDRAGAEGL